VNNFNSKSVVLFDGVCNLCNSSLNFIISNDKKAHFLFASLQSDAAKEILLQFPEKKINFNTIVLIDQGKYYEKSTAVARICKRLDGLYKFLYFMVIIPKFIRDGLYNFIAKKRYKWYGKREKCRIPAPELRNRFLN
jgi:predicted DCC family thiol-disulfide oxidoreductase YuxK